MAEHRHQWVQHQVELWPGPTPDKAISGITVVWRCRSRGCQQVYAQRKPIRKPLATSQGNLWGRPVSALVGEDLAREVYRRRKQQDAS